jgi:hypothetical protein
VAVKSIIDIQVNDGEFKRFNALFLQYQKTLNATPVAWRRIAQEQGKGTKAFEELVALEIQSLGHQKMMLQVQSAATRLTRTSADYWKEMGRNTKGVAADIRDMTGSLLKWASLTSVFSGLIGAGGLFGITRMAESVAAGRRSSLGLGASYGEQKAFKNSFDRIVDSDAFLAGMNESLHSASGKASLFGVGLRGSDLNGSTSDVGLRFLEKARALAKSSDPQFDAETMKARGLDRHISLQDFQRLRSTSDNEFNDLRGRYGRNVGAFGVGSPDQLAYQNFVTTIDEAGNKLNAVFVRGITPLIPSLEKLSTATTDAVKAFLESPMLKDWIKGASDGLEAFAVQVSKPEFKTAVEGFVTNVSDFVGSFNSFVGFIKNPLAGPPKDQDYVGKAATWLNGKIKGVAHDYNPFSSESFAGGALRVKPGAGYIDPGLGALAAKIQGDIPGIKRFTAFNDDYHKGTGSAHADNRAFDLTLNNPSKANYARTAEMMRAELKRLGIAAKVIDEANNPSSRATGAHLHVQTERQVDVKIMNAAGSSVIVQSSQLSAGGFPQ